ncbi:MAG: hypothetical protein Q4C63_07070 [Eubacteriales bacterium]|nr:hypothetical protein [Eubacteriales bacterium]
MKYSVVNVKADKVFDKAEVYRIISSAFLLYCQKETEDKSFEAFRLYIEDSLNYNGYSLGAVEEEDFLRTLMRFGS